MTILLTNFTLHGQRMVTIDANFIVYGVIANALNLSTVYLDYIVLTIYQADKY